MPLVRVSRDKRGYEHTYLIQVADGGARAEQPRLLYWFRTPPGLKVGREPLDQAARRALETQYPDLAFDWRSLAAATAPPVEQTNWRERREAARAAKRARGAEDGEGAKDGSAPSAARAGGKTRQRSRRGRANRPDPGPADKPLDPS